MRLNKLNIVNLSVNLNSKQILINITLTINSGEIHAIMGPNGSGKSTLAQTLMGHPNYQTVRSSQVTLNQLNLVGQSPEERAKSGLFLAMQNPVGIPGVNVTNLLRSALEEITPDKRKVTPKTHIQNPLLARRFSAGGLTIGDFHRQLRVMAGDLRIEESLLIRGINDGFSGGEKKKMELLQALILKPKFAIFDEIDTGLDVDALKLVAAGIKKLVKLGAGIIIITHYQRILRYLQPDYVHILVKGKIVKSGKSQLARQIEKQGYSQFI